jgi:dolichol-phosphate mannosyltransferase
MQTGGKGEAGGRQALSVVLSFRNEADVIPELIDRLEAVLDRLPLDYEVIFVNDDSTDGSLDLLRARAARNPRVKVVNMARRFGVSECVIAGLEYARGDAVIYMDADLQDPPELIPEMVAKWQAGAEVVYTVRTRRLKENPFKMWLTRLAYRAIGTVSEVDLPENSGDFRLVSRRVRDWLLRLPESDPYIRGLVRWIGFRQEPVHYERAARAGGRGHFPLLRSLNPSKTFVMGLTSFSLAPVYLVLMTGLAVGLLSGLGLVVLGLAALFGAALVGIAWIAFLLFLWGGLLFAVGIVGIYVTRIFKEVRGRPRYIVRDTVGLSGPLPPAS